MEKMKPITLSWKQTPEEIEIYKIISKHTSRGAFIKDILITTLLKTNIGNAVGQNNNITSNVAKANDELNEIFDL